MPVSNRVLRKYGCTCSGPGDAARIPTCRTGFATAVIRSLSPCKKGAAFSSGFICTSNRISFYNIG